MTSAWTGSAQPLGATWNGRGVNFALFSAHATAVTLCLFDRAESAGETARIPLHRLEDGSWQGFVPGLAPGQLYGYRVDGPWQPEQGHWFNPQKLLVDPYARRLSHSFAWSDALVSAAPAAAGSPARPDLRDSAPLVPKAVVPSPGLPHHAGGGEAAHPSWPWTHTVVYECHVKGMTRLHPKVPEALRGTYLGLASDPVLDHLRALGVTTLELLPVHQSGVDAHLARNGLTNYWGYNPISWFAPDVRFATAGGDPVAEFRAMVRRLHAAGLEVLLDVVYNHTGEGGPEGPTLSLRGIDNASYYRLHHNARASYEDFTGCGNSLDLRQPAALRLVLDSLRYWAEEMHVDGFRFDLATTLARDPGDFDPSGRFLAAVSQDPVLSRLKLVAEPWDLGSGGYRLGGFPYGWREWNDRYRDGVRRFWRGDPGQAPELASRLSGSSDLFAAERRGPTASINYVSCHDGFTLADLVSYERKHNEANGEGNRDGSDANASRNWGVEGPSDDPAIRALRLRNRRNLLATLFLSQGVPMLGHGDELGRTQGGNNNAYCQDGPLSWLHWTGADGEDDLTGFVARLAELRRRHPALRRRFFFAGEPPAPGAPKDVTWLGPDGSELLPAAWADPALRVFGMWIHGAARHDLDETAAPVQDRTLLLLVNAEPQRRSFTLPPDVTPCCWRELVCTARDGRGLHRAPTLRLAEHSLMLLSHEPEAAEAGA